MTPQEKNDFWRISLSLTAIFTIIYLIAYSGTFPSLEKVVLSNLVVPGKSGPNVLTLPFAISRIFDPLFVFMTLSFIILLFQRAIRGFNVSVDGEEKQLEEQSENEKKEIAKKEQSELISFGIFIGFAAALVFGLGCSVIALYKNEVLLGLFLMIIVGFGASFMASLISNYEAALFFSLMYSLTAGLIYGLLEISSLSISLGFVVSIIIFIFAMAANSLIMLIRSIFTGKIQ
ncbi:MAG: hypothetical protein ACOYL8_04670 [Patescibacteria group bacterium]